MTRECLEKGNKIIENLQGIDNFESYINNAITGTVFQLNEEQKKQIITALAAELTKIRNDLEKKFNNIQCIEEINF